MTDNLFDLITFVITFGEDASSLKRMATLFKMKPEMLKCLVQIPRYSSDLSVESLQRPRESARTEQTMLMVKDFLQVPPAISHKYNALVEQCHKDVQQNDNSLWSLCNAMDASKKVFQPKAWLFLQSLTLPSDEDFNEMTSRCVYAMLNLELDSDQTDDVERYLANCLVRVIPEAGWNEDMLKDATFKLWAEVRRGLRGLLGICTRNMAQVIAYLHASKPRLDSTHGPGLAIKLAVATTSGNSEHLVEHLSLTSADTSTSRVLKDLATTLTRGTGVKLNPTNELEYHTALEAMCVLSIFRRSGDPQGTLRESFGTTLRKVSEKVCTVNASDADGASMKIYCVLAE